MGFEAVHAAAAEGDDQELRKCLEGLDKDRNGLFDRENPAPAVVIGKPKGIHGRFNQATPALVAGTMGDTALHKAAERGQVTAVAYILGLASHGLPVAADGGAGPGLHVEDAQPIPEGWDDVEKLIHAKNHAGETPLHLAATGGSVDCVRLLLDAGSNPIAQDSVKGWTPLHCAASQRHLQVLACLLDAKADPNAVDYQGGTALHTCARYEVEEGLWLLASAGCMLDLQRVTDGYTALHVACKWSNLPFTAMALLHLRADPSLVSRGGRPAALLAAREGASDVLEKVQEIHWKLCLENPDKQGLSRIKAGGQLTVRAAFDKAMERAALRMSNPNDHDLWYNPSDSSVTEWRRLGGFDGADVFTVNDGVPQGRWVSAGPLAESALEEIISSELTNAYDLLTSKAGFYTPKEKVKELVDNEVQPVIDAIRTANAAWTKAKAAREVFDMEGAEVAFNTAARALASDWWGQGAEAYGRRLAMECKALRNLKLELDSTMEKADKMRQKFQFLEAMAMYDSAWGGFGSYGDTERSFEGLYRVEEMRRKAAMKEEADRRVKESQKQVTERAEIESFPHSRLCIEEAVENLERATELYKAYGDKATFDTVSNRLTAYKWNLEKQGKGNRILKSGQDLMDESVPDHDTTYTPTADYPPGQILAKIRFSDAIVDFKQAMLYMADIGDEHVLRIASDLRDLATKNAALHQQAQDYLQEGQQLEVQYTHDPRLAHLVTFCVHLVDGNQVPVEPYVRHAIDQEYELTHRKETGASMHRLQLEEALVQFEAAHETFKLFDDGVNAAEAQRQADRLRFNLELQGKAHKKMHDGLLSLQERKYGDGHASYSEAVVIFTQIEDEVNGKYAKMLTNDAASKRKLGEEAHKKMQEGLELLELRSRFTNWMQVQPQPLPTLCEITRTKTTISVQTVRQECGFKHESAGRACHVWYRSRKSTRKKPHSLGKLY